MDNKDCREVLDKLNDGTWKVHIERALTHAIQVMQRIEDIEVMAELVHKSYCQYQLDNGKEYWTKGDYSLLDDKTKEIDRYTVRAISKYLGGGSDGTI